MNLLFIDVGEEDVATSSENCPGEKFNVRIIMSHDYDYDYDEEDENE